MQARRKPAGNPIGQAPFFAHLFSQTRGKSAAAQNVVTHQQGKKVGGIAFDAWLPDQDLRLGRVKGDEGGVFARYRRARGELISPWDEWAVMPSASF